LPGNASQAASPASQRLTRVPEAAAIAATLNACAHRSGSSIPATTLTTNGLKEFAVMEGRLPHMLEIVYTGLVVGALALLGIAFWRGAFRLFMSQG
jgi:hypothetical protein